ncbi:hypothetical protein HER10_EVM0004938 [Colletotrichum scovillei]|uniref:uncharacterized protein n=1 Tax=Colletotrichum scovillei TaxID=1209932 RepID=UPI0015C2E2A5|nr:uncharacterized protein HER10_EVM0004938 [Colletotrichum scovillei]KAF4774941.1 hypothetical protein HER10_EVM0004938 [Colletotrichum scovillei]
MSKGCVEPDSSDVSLARIIYAFTWLLVHIGLVRMIANASTHQPAPQIHSGEAYLYGVCPDRVYFDRVYSDRVYLYGVYSDRVYLDRVYSDRVYLDRVYSNRVYSDRVYSDRIYLDRVCLDRTRAIKNLSINSDSNQVTIRANIDTESEYNVLKTIDLDADPYAAFTSTEKETLESFEENLRDKRLEISCKLGFRLPIFHASLVSVTFKRTLGQVVMGGSDATGRTETLIRITGLRDRRQMSSFHDVLTMKKYRSLYEPLNLCYHKDRVLRMALEASCAIRDPAQTLTLCGCTIIIQTPGQDPRTSTLGGLLTVRGKFYALTTSHMPDDDDGFSEDASDYESDDDIGSLFFFDKNDDLEDERSNSVTPFEFDDGTGKKDKTAVQLPKTASLDVDIGKSEATTREESVPRLSPEGKESRTAGLGASPMKSGVAATTHIITKSSSQKKGFLNLIEGDNLKSGDDWLLVPVGTNFLFPNRLPAGVQKPATWQNHFIESFCPDLGKLFVDENDPNKPPSQRTVWAIAGMGGLIRSSLCPNPSFILSNGCEKSSKVWMVEAEAPSQGFQAGDSGSWIVDDKTRRVLGILVARVGGVGYMTSFAMEQAPDMRSWGQWLSDGTAATLDIVRHPIDLGFSKAWAVLFTAIVYVIALSIIQGPWESWNSLQLALALPGCVLLFWVSSELRSGQEPQNRPSQDVLVWRRRAFCTWLWISLGAGILVGCGNQILRPTIPEDTRSEDEKTRDWNKGLEYLKDFMDYLSASLSTFRNDLEDLQRALQDGDVRAILAKLREMFSRRLPRVKRSNKVI